MQLINLRKTIKWYTFSSLPLGLASLFFTLGFQSLLCTAGNSTIALVNLLAVLLVYNWYYLHPNVTDKRDNQHSWLITYKKIIYAYLAMIALVIIYLVFFTVPYNAITLTIVTFLCLAYKYFIKKITSKAIVLKNILLGLIWSLSLFIIKIPTITTALVCYAACIFFQILGMSLQFDIFNYNTDKILGSRSVAVLLGIKTTNIISIICIFVSYIMVLLIPSTIYLIAICGSQLFLIFLSKKIRNYLFFYAVMDSCLLFISLSIYLILKNTTN